MSKYIIEIAKEYEEYFKGILICGIADGKFAVDVIAREDLEELNSDYINEHFGDLQQDAYDRGYKDGRNVTETQAHDDAYQRGLDDAWEAARKLFSSMADSDIEKAFPTEWNNGGFNALINLQPQEAIAKLKAYEEKQKDDEIKIGDEVTDIQSGANFLVTHLWKSNHGDKGVSGFNNDCSAFSATLNKVSKTGRHFDIESILEDMRHD